MVIGGCNNVDEDVASGAGCGDGSSDHCAICADSIDDADGAAGVVDRWRSDGSRPDDEARTIDLERERPFGARVEFAAKGVGDAGGTARSIGRTVTVTSCCSVSRIQ
ncbi:MAG: hypothetical protein ACK5O2_04440 [Microthrixaceae bacterium]